MISADVVRSIIAGMKLPRLELYSGDWLKDQVSACSLAAQGLWFRMLLAMHDSKPYGHLSDAVGNPLQEHAIIRRCGVSGPREYRKLVAELREAGTPGWSGDEAYKSPAIREAEINSVPIDLSPLFLSTNDVLYSRRLLRDQRLRVLRKLAGNPSLLTTQKAATFGVLPTQTSSISPHVQARALAGAGPDDGDSLDSLEQLSKSPEGVQGEPSQQPVPVPDFGAVERVSALLDGSALRDKPSLQIVTAWLTEFDEALIRETLGDCEPSYAGKGYQYLERILTTRRDNPDQRPGQRRAKGTNGNGTAANGRRDATGGASEARLAESRARIAGWGEHIVVDLREKSD